MRLRREVCVCVWQTLPRTTHVHLRLEEDLKLQASDTECEGRGTKAAGETGGTGGTDKRGKRRVCGLRARHPF